MSNLSSSCFGIGGGLCFPLLHFLISKNTYSVYAYALIGLVAVIISLFIPWKVQDE